ncbi:YdgA family protein [Beggiatoa leptomitoformis]|uniref:DUF945 family protein n=1 Tax=Beggiatoa leptomitoformis TaxID=288004 RepID=A0A2N9YGM4_9GAMM|nr:DUF945 family protein [Beggiatoa leptomitoformis]ALG68166.1 DUF945 family protein [Beggiatoa leptomitoformis]AUI69535.1 DUF945 family protein [Beggiatoa leptomitoformis]
MKKQTLFIFSLTTLGLVILLIPYITGMKAEEQFSFFTKQLPDNIQFITHDYQRGWLGSTADSTLSIYQDANTPAQTIQLQQEMDHGFLPLKPAIIYTTIRTTLPTASTGNQITGETSPLRIRTELQANGDVSNTLNIAQSHLQQQENTVQWQDLTGEFNLTQSGHLATTTLHIPQLKSQFPFGEFTVHDGLIQANIEENIANLLIGQGNLHIAQIRFDSPTGLTASLSNLHINTYNIPSESFLTLRIVATAQELHIIDKTYRDIRIVMEFNQLHQPSLQNIVLQLNELRQLHPTSQLQLNFWLLGILMRDGMTLLNHHPSFAITELSLNSDEGKVNGTLSVQVDTVPSQPFFNLQALQNSIICEVTLETPKTLLNQWLKAILFQPDLSSQAAAQTIMNTRLQQLETQGILLSSADNQVYKTALLWKNGKLMANGQSIVYPEIRVQLQ